jgi:hypothetical protein
MAGRPDDRFLIRVRMSGLPAAEIKAVAFFSDVGNAAMMAMGLRKVPAVELIEIYDRDKEIVISVE